LQIVGLVFVFSIGLVFFVARTVTRPINVLTKATWKAARAICRAAHVKLQDEVGQLTVIQQDGGFLAAVPRRSELAEARRPPRPARSEERLQLIADATNDVIWTKPDHE